MRASSQQMTRIALARGGASMPHMLLGCEGDGAVVRERREVVEPVRVRDEPVVAERLAELLHAPMEVADVGRRGDDALAVDSRARAAARRASTGADGPMLSTMRSPKILLGLIEPDVGQRIERSLDDGQRVDLGLEESDGTVIQACLSRNAPQTGMVESSRFARESTREVPTNRRQQDPIVRVPSR